jgi:hypothetical protein
MKRIESVMNTVGFSFGLALATFVAEYFIAKNATEEPLAAILLAALHACAALLLSAGLIACQWDRELAHRPAGQLLLATAMIGALAVSRILWFTPESGIERRLALPGVTEPIGQIDTYGFAAAYVYLILRHQFRRADDKPKESRS